MSPLRFPGRRPHQRRKKEQAAAAEVLAPGARVEVVRAYHRATYHDFHRYAAGPGGLDWDNQPDPFRCYDGAPRVALEHLDAREGAAYDAVYRAGTQPPAPLDRVGLAALFEYSLGLAAWKEYQGSRWALRVNPSSGNLHPTEAHVLLPSLEGVADAPVLAHYAPREHALELRARLPVELWERLSAGLPAGSFFVGLTSIHWREAWKYGERAYRYCQHDAGHAIACLSLAAGALGWRARLLDEWGAPELARLLGLEDPGASEPETPDGLLAVTPEGEGAARPAGEGPALEELPRLELAGQPNQLSPEHVEWRAIELVAEACEKPRTPPPPEPERAPAIELPGAGSAATFRHLARQRRSAVAMDGRGVLAREAFLRMLGRTLPVAGARPFDALTWAPRVHLGLFVHGVEGLAPGLYALVRDPAALATLRAEMRAEFSWEPVAGAPAGLGLHLLAPMDARRLAAALSCQQEIAGDGAFSLGMLCELERPLEELGAWVYPHLYWECGALGQVLYLEAEAAGVRATGIGCYFDRPVHEAFGLRGERFQSLYHFTVGTPVEDTRLTIRPPYPPPG